MGFFQKKHVVIFTLCKSPRTSFIGIEHALASTSWAFLKIKLTSLGFTLHKNIYRSIEILILSDKCFFSAKILLDFHIEFGPSTFKLKNGGLILAKLPKGVHIPLF